MIADALKIIQTGLENAGIVCTIGSIPANNDGHDVIASLVNIGELREFKQSLPLEVSGQIQPRPLHLELIVLFAAHVGDKYAESLRKIDQLIAYFYKNSVFDGSSIPGDVTVERVVVEMMSLNLEQLHQLWSVVGDKYRPSVVYKMRVFEGFRA